jgi:hypothetical protein
MRRIGSNARLAALLLLAGIVACGDDDDGGGSIGPTGEGRLTLIIKDAPGDVQAAIVTISEISLSTIDTRRVISTTPITLDLSPLSTGDSTILNEAVIPAGEYTRLQLKLDGAAVQVEGADSVSSQVFATSPDYQGIPAGATVSGTLSLTEPPDSNGFEVTLAGGGFRIEDGANDTLVIDFDVARSFSGDSAGWTLAPALSASETGSLGSATVTLGVDSAIQPIFDSAGISLGQFSSTFTGSDSVARTVPFTGPDSSGKFIASLRFLPAGSFNVDIVGPPNVTTFTTDSALPGVVTVGGGTTATTAFTITSATLAP